MAITLLFGQRLLPERSGSSLPADFSAHARTLVEQYRLEDGLHRLRVRSTSPYVGARRSDVDLKDYPGLSLVAIQEGESARRSRGPRSRRAMCCSCAATRRRGATRDRQASRRPVGGSAGGVAETLFNRRSGLAEVVIPPRSKLVGQTVFPGMVTPDGDLMVLAVQRGGEDLGPQPTTLAVGDHLLLQGTWQALDKQLADPQVLVVDSPEVVRRQALALGPGAKEAIAILAVLVVLLATSVVPPAIAGLICAAPWCSPGCSPSRRPTRASIGPPAS